MSTIVGWVYRLLGLDIPYGPTRIQSARMATMRSLTDTLRQVTEDLRAAQDLAETRRLLLIEVLAHHGVVHARIGRHLRESPDA